MRCGPIFSAVSAGRGPEEMALRCHSRDSDLVLEKMFSLRVVRYWNWLYRELVKSLSLEAFKRRLDLALSDVVKDPRIVKAGRDLHDRQVQPSTQRCHTTPKPLNQHHPALPLQLLNQRCV